EEIAQALLIAPTHHMGWNAMTTHSHSLRDTACGKLRISQPQKQQMHMITALLEAGEPRCEAAARQRGFESEVFARRRQLPHPREHDAAGRDRDRFRPERRQTAG